MPRKDKDKLPPRLLSIEQANSLLPEVRRVLAELRVCRDQVDKLDKQKAVEELSWLQPDGTVSDNAKAEVERLDQMQKARMKAFEETVEGLMKIGVQIKDLDQGLVDFFTPRGEGFVLLCWKEGEEAIAHWHDLESGYAGRRPLSEL